MEISTIVAVVCGILSLGMIVWAILLFCGKGYKSIAGNSDTSDEDIAEQQKSRLGLGVGIILLIGAIIVGIPAMTAITALL